MLTRVHIKGFRSCHDVTLANLGQVVALIGRNSAGKSNVLKAIAALGQLACSAGPESQGWEDLPPIGLEDAGVEPPLSFEADVMLGEASYWYRASAAHYYKQEERKFSLTMQFREELEYQVSERRRELVFQRSGEAIKLPQKGSQVNVGHGVGALTALASLYPEGDPVRAVTDPLRRFFAQIGYYPLDEPAESREDLLLSKEKYSRWLTEYNASGNLGSSVPAQVLYLCQNRPERFADLKARLGQNGLRLIEDMTVQPLERGNDKKSVPQYYFVFFFHGGGSGGPTESYPFGQLSQGTRRIIRLLTAMSFGDCSVMLIEHPEDSVHKGLTRKLAGLFTGEASESQIILSTHSDTLMNQLDPESVRFVSMETGSTSVRKLSPDELDAACEYVSSTADGTLAEFLHSMED